ncbi:hypothetical protein D3C87_1777370 [compost metagenome]
MVALKAVNLSAARVVILRVAATVRRLHFLPVAAHFVASLAAAKLEADSKVVVQKASNVQTIVSKKKFARC